MQNALQAAEQAEAERVTALHAREWQARKRSLAQKAGQLERDAAEVARLTEALQTARNRMAETGQGIVALLPPSLRTNARPYPAMLATRTLRELCSLESWRLDQDAPKPKLVLTSYWPNFEDAATGRISPLTELVGQLCASLKRVFDNTAPAPSQDLVPAQTTQPTQPAQDEEESASQFCEQVAKEGALTNE